jgi:hypothetical protein
MCLYVDVIMEGVAWKKIGSMRLFIRSSVKCIYPTGAISPLHFNNISVGHP